MNPFHTEILEQIQKKSGPPDVDAFLNGYLGNDHIRYPIAAPAMRAIAKDWMRAHRDLKPDALAKVITSLIEGESSTEKMMAGIVLGYSAKTQRDFNPTAFDRWLDHLVGWAEVDALCTGDFLISQVPSDWDRWKTVIFKLSKSKNINKRRASLVLFCSPLGRVRDERLAEEAFNRIELLKSEKEVLITKAISWVLRTMVKLYREEVAAYLADNAHSLPKIAVRETRVKLETGRKKKHGE